MKRKYILTGILVGIMLIVSACDKKNNSDINSTSQTEDEVVIGSETGTEITSEIDTESTIATEVETEETETEETDTEVPKDSHTEPQKESQQESSKVEQHSHTYTEVATKAATCSEQGIKTYSCSCGYSYTETIEMTNHIESSWQVMSEPTQTDDGVMQTVCTNCNVQMATRLTPCTQVSDNVSKYWSYYEEILALVNELRAEVGVGSVELDYDLCVAATKRSVEMDYQEWFGHDRPDGRSCFTVIEDYGFAGANFGENIASGQHTAEEVFECWKSSPGHYAVMTEARFTKLGVGYCDEWYWHEWDLKRLWVQMFSD